MTPLLIQLNPKPSSLAPIRGMPRPESDVIAGRIASHRRWARRRQALRLRAALFGRHKLAIRPVPARPKGQARRPATA